MKIKADMDAENTDFVVEVAILPMQKVVEKSRVYALSEPDVDITLEEAFELSCTHTEIEESTLLLAVRPIYSGNVLFAEADLKDLSLSSGKEVHLRGYLKSLT